jgi:hypothetical protein
MPPYIFAFYLPAFLVRIIPLNDNAIAFPVHVIELHYPGYDHLRVAPLSPSHNFWKDYRT